MDTTIPCLGECSIASPLDLSTQPGDGLGDFVTGATRVRYSVRSGGKASPEDGVSFEAAGPRGRIFFDPRNTRAAIVTCGGICPGLNNVIRSAFLELHYNYGVPEVLGIRYGYAGLNPACGFEPVRLDRDIVDHIHEHGGTFLGTSRGPQPPEVMVQYLIDNHINILLCVGGDGTLRGAHAISDEAMKRRVPIAVVGVPKTIDNDVRFVARTFGVNTAVERSAEILECAHIEARSVFNGIGLVKLMGREAGFIACGATLASQEVNLTLIPEVPFSLDEVMRYLRARLERRGHALVVVAEGAGQHLLACDEGGVDRSGNKKLADIGPWLKQQIAEYFKKQSVGVEVKYFDPSYYIRSVRANSSDSIFCDQLARDAVHAAMAGKTAVVISYWNDTFMHVPMDLVTCGKKQVDPEGPLWTGVLAATGQPRRFAQKAQT